MQVWWYGARVRFPDIKEVKPFTYDKLGDSSKEHFWYLRECAICLEEFTNRDLVVHLPCGHLYHTECVEDYISRTLQCPVKCRQEGFILSFPGGRRQNVPPTLVGGNSREDDAHPQMAQV